MNGLEAGIVTTDAAALAAFYTDALGFEVVSVHEFPQGAVHRLRRGAARVKLFQPAGGADRRVRPDPWHRDCGFAYAALLVTDAAAVVAAARAHGASVLVDVVEHRSGARYALVADPHGNVLEILQEEQTS